MNFFSETMMKKEHFIPINSKGKWYKSNLIQILH